MIVAVPAATPVTTPVELIVATDVLLLVQVPPEVASDNVVVEPVATDDAPVIAAITGKGLTVIVMVAALVPHAFERV